MRNQIQPLTPPAFYVLLSLHETERHGYDIMKQIADYTSGQINIGPGTLYGLVKRLLGEGLIEENDERADTSGDDERRRYYRLTSEGRRRLGTEVKRLQAAVTKAQELGVSFKTSSYSWIS
jgi:DNA-binding PadR family transcriptional regulator